MHTPTIVIVISDATLRCSVHGLLLHCGYDVVPAADIPTFLATTRQRPALVIVGHVPEGAWDGVEAAQRLRRWDRTLPIVLLAQPGSEALVIAALRSGVNDYLKFPCSGADLAASVQRCLAAVVAPAIQATPTHGPTDSAMLTGESPSMAKIKAYISKVAPTDSNVLITGETGTGKELVAALIHRHSARWQKPFVCLNCAAIPDSLLESELFGYERGAFTGAHTARAGTLQLAEGGTVFLDEIGDMSPYAQAKILRTLESREVQRLGGKQPIRLNIRVIAATNQELERLMAEGKFRQDLYFRLHVVRIHLPPLRDRKEDIPVLLEHYIQDANHRFGLDVQRFTDEAMTHLLRYAWPGNVRELKNLIEAAFVDLPLWRVSFLDLPELFYQQCQAAVGQPQNERDQVLSALLMTRWNKSKAAQKLHWSRMTLYRKMAKYHIVSGGKTTVDQVSGAAGPL